MLVCGVRGVWCVRGNWSSGADKSIESTQEQDQFGSVLEQLLIKTALNKRTARTLGLCLGNLFDKYIHIYSFQTLTKRIWAFDPPQESISPSQRVSDNG